MFSSSFCPPFLRRRTTERYIRAGTEEGGSATPDASAKKSIWALLKGDAVVLRRLAPYLWPASDLSLKVRVVLSLVLLVVAKLFTILVPITYKHSVDDLSTDPAKGGPTFPVQWILLYAFLRLLSSASGDIRDAAFVRVTQNALKQAALDTFDHLHSLSLRFHMHRQTGMVLKALERGINGINFLLSMLLFNIVPTLLEMLLVCGYLLIFYEFLFSFMTFVTIVSYITFTLVVTEWRNKFRREMNDKDNDASNKAVDSLINYETVKYFCNERHESKRYGAALTEKMVAAEKSYTSLALLNIGQSAIIAVGCLAVMLLAGRRAVDGDMTVGDFVLVNTYLLQLYLPLGFLGTSYRMIKTSLVDLENMFALLDEQHDVLDHPDAKELVVRRAAVKFDRVMFAYEDPSKPVLRDISFEIPPGRTVAVVGPTGAGKSTLARLLFRFYDVNSGSITIDGQDISRVTQTSLRRSIGVVPQDTVLFNDTIAYNIKYGRAEEDIDQVDDEEMFAAAKLAQIHDFIVSLPEGYNTKVGERGLRLSGGEKQRVSIARAILKNPPIMIFDEATSALDTHTEKLIQSSLRQVSKGRTTLIVAHRLSTIVDADEILVLAASSSKEKKVGEGEEEEEQGGIVERGTHEELLALNGRYKAMWDKQLEITREKKPEESQEEQEDKGKDK
ncbi:Metal ABC transporter permease [Balamuthia mandrillaris]